MSHVEQGHEQIELLEMRPRFRLRSPLTAEEVKQMVADAVKSDGSVHGWMTKHHAHLHIPRQFQHYWSPVLHAGIEDDEWEGGCIIRVLIGPKQHIWAMFTYMKAAIGLLGVFGGMYGLSQWQLDKPAWALWSMPVALLLAGSLFVIAKMGQQKGHAEMEFLIRFLHKALKDARLERDQPR